MRRQTPKIAYSILNKTMRQYHRASALDDLEEEFEFIQENSGYQQARLWYWKQALRSVPFFINHLIYWSFIMIKNYFKLTFRNISRHKGYSAINILGLAAGITCFIFIMLYIQFELSYDNYHQDADQIYRVCKSRKTEAKLTLFAANVNDVAPTLLKNYPEVIAAGRAGTMGVHTLTYKNQKFVDKKMRYADQGFLDLFNIEPLAGDLKTALTRPLTTVINQTVAQKLFGNENPVGKTIQIDTLNYEITAVIKDCPANTHNKFSVLCYFDISRLEHNEPWNGWHCMNYIKLRDGVDAAAFEEKIKLLPHDHVGEMLEKRGITFTIFLQPLKDIHLHSNLSWEAEPNGNVTYIYIFSLIGAFILIIACINFMNLSTARSANRAGEVGMRKVVGAQRSQLIFQFLSESLFMTILSLLIVFPLVIFLLPSYNGLINTFFTVSDVFHPAILFSVAGAVLFIGIIAGSYPAFVLSSFKPDTILRGALQRGSKGALFRKFLVVGQFSISIVLIIGTILFFKQLQYMKDKKLGFNKEQKLVVEFNRSRYNSNTYQAVKNEFLKHPNIEKVSFSSSVPGRWMYFWHLWPMGKQKTNNQMVNCFQVDHDFFNVYELEMAAGKSLDVKITSSLPGGAWIINEEAARAFGWGNPQEAINQHINRQNNQIIGVVKNFHLKGLQNKIEPMAVFLMSEDYRYMTMNVSTGNLEETLAFVEETFNNLCEGDIFQYFFLDQDFDRQYRSEERLSKIFLIFTFFGIFIACLGLFGLASFIAEQRTKEIGIRKVLGASVSQVVFLLSFEFVKWVLLANIIAWPAAWFGMHLWLQDFAYRIDMQLWPFILSTILALLISILTVSFQAMRAAAANPVESLKYE